MEPTESRGDLRSPIAFHVRSVVRNGSVENPRSVGQTIDGAGDPDALETAESSGGEQIFVDGQERHVDPRAVLVARVVGFSVVLVLSLAQLTLLAIGRAVGGLPGATQLALFGAWLLLQAILLAFVYHWPAERYRRLLYLAEEDGLRIRRGVFWRKTIWIPVTRVQHTDVSQGPIQRRFGLGTLTVHTAGTAKTSVSLAGLEHGVAARLSDHLHPAKSADGG